MTHEFCITFVDKAGKEVLHRHVEARNDEHAAVAAAMEAAEKGIDVSECDAMIKVIKVIPPTLKEVIKTVIAVRRALGLDEEPAADTLSMEAIKKGVAESVGAEQVNGEWAFPDSKSEAEYHRRLAGILDTATPAPSDRPSTKLH